MSKKQSNKIKKRTLYIIIIILLISNIFFFSKGITHKPEQQIEEFTFYQKCTELKYKESKKYYKNIDYSKFKKMYNKKSVYNIAIVDSTSNTYNSFLTLINHIAYYKSTNIFTLDISKLSKKNSVEFYEIDERLSEVDGNYLMTINNKKVISITEIEQSEISTLIKEMEQ